MNRRFWIAWAVTLGGIVAVYLVWWARARDPSPLETSYARTGIVALVTGIPLIVAALQLPKIKDQGSPAWWVVPAILGVLVVIVALAAGFMPDRATECAFLDRSGRIEPTCATSSAMRRGALLEVTAVWLAFGTLGLVTGRRRT